MKKQTVRYDETRIITKPFCSTMKALAHALMKLLRDNNDLLQLNNIDLSTVFTHCSVLLHYSIPTVKPVSTMSIHSDITYDKNGNYIPSQNSQRVNTPTLVYSLGDARTINFKKKIIPDFSSIIISKDWKHAMSMPEGSCCLIHNLDETPKAIEKSDCKRSFLHGNVKVNKGKMSIGLGFRVVDYVNHYDNNNVLIHPTPVPHVADFKEKYSQFDYIQFQNLLRQLYFKVFGTVMIM